MVYPEYAQSWFWMNWKCDECHTYRYEEPYRDKGKEPQWVWIEPMNLFPGLEGWHYE